MLLHPPPPPAFVQVYKDACRLPMAVRRGRGMTGSFDKAFSLVVGGEGGYVNDPKDPGGETKFGISKRSYPSVDIKALTLDGAKILYRPIWDAIHGDALPWPLSLFVFDAAINQGEPAAIALLQKSLGMAQDGILGVKTRAAAAKSPPDLCPLFMADRALRYTGTRNFDVYGRGWLKRLFTVAIKAT